MVCCRLVISGMVQGVFYRHHCREKAEELNLKGFVKNLSNGRVEVVADGKKEAIEKLIEWCWKGSPAASVKNVKVEELKDNKEAFDGFEIRY